MTGPIGAGKSEVARIWVQLGAGLVEGDVMGRLALETNAKLCKVLADRFGQEILNQSGEIDRSLLARMAFATPEGRADLTAFTFPTLYRLAQEHFDRLGNQTPVVVFDAALIYEWGIEEDFDRIVVVTAPLELLYARVMARLGISREEAEQRLLAQLAPAEKERRADHLIINDGTLADLRMKARQVWADLTS